MHSRGAWPAVLLLAGCMLDGVAPLPSDDHARTVEDTAIVIEVLANDYGEHDFLSLSAPGSRSSTYASGSLATATLHGTVLLGDDDTVLYTPGLDFHGEDEFFYVVGYRGANARARVTVEVAPDSEQFGDPIALYESDAPMVAFAAERGGAAPSLIVQEGDRVVALERGQGLELHAAQTFGDASCCLWFDAPAVVADFDGNGLSDVVRFGMEHSLDLELAQPAEGGADVRYEAHSIDYYGPNAIELDRNPAGAWPRRGAAGDFDGDGELDLAVGLDSAPGVIVHLGMASGTPRASRVFGTGGVRAIESGDLDGDGTTDLVALADDEIVWFRADPASPSGFAIVMRPWGRAGVELRVGDIDGRPGDEVVLPDREPAEVFRALVGPNGAVLEQLPSTEPDMLFFPTLADLDGDGRADLLGTPRSSRGLEWWRSVERDGKPAFIRAADFLSARPGRWPLVLDFDRDGTLDVIVSRSLENRPQVELVLLPGRP